MKLEEQRFVPKRIDKSRFHIRQGEKALWPAAQELHSWLSGQNASGALIEEMKDAGFTWPTILLLANKGGMAKADSEGSGFDAISMADMTPDWLDMDTALRIGSIRGMEWKCVWHASGVQPESSEIIARVIGDEEGHLSGTTRLLMGPQREVVEVHFQATENGRPVVAAHYQPKEG